MLRLSPDSVWNSRGANGVSTGKQVVASASAAVCLTVLKVWDRSVELSWWSASWDVLIRSAASSTPPHAPPRICPLRD